MRKFFTYKRAADQIDKKVLIHKNIDIFSSGRVTKRKRSGRACRCSERSENLGVPFD